MLTIRKEQLGVFAEAAQADFERRLYEHLHAVLQRYGIDLAPDGLARQVKLAAPAAARFHLERECDVACYAEIVLCCLGSLDEEPRSKEALNILYAYGVDPEEKLDRFRAWATEQGGPPRS